jgi:hypothetical protein
MAETSLLKRLGAFTGAALLAVALSAGAASAATSSSSSSSPTMAKHQQTCEANATKKKLTGDQKTAYVNKCMQHTSTKKKKHTTAKTAPSETPPAATAPKG